MRSAGKPNHETAASPFVLPVFLGLFLAVWGTIHLIRLASVFHDSIYESSSGLEGFSLYGIYKAWKGAPVYQPLTENPSGQIYNWLFYYGYGQFARLFVKHPQDLVLYARLFTGAIGFFGACFLSFFLRSEVRTKAPGADSWKAIVTIFPWVMFLGPYPGWWTWTARPDIAAAVLELAALIFCLAFFERGVWAAVGATLVFGLAWSFKQTAFFGWLGFILWLVSTRRHAQAVVSLSLFSLVVLVPFVRFGADYVDHAVWFNWLAPWKVRTLARDWAESFLTGLYVFLPAVWAAWDCAKRGIWRRGGRAGLLFFVFLSQLVGAILISGHSGSSRNYGLSAYESGGFFFLYYFSFLSDPPGFSCQKILKQALAFGLVVGFALGVLYLAFPQRFGKIHLISAARRQKVVRLQEKCASARRPLFVEPTFYAVPWFSGNDPAELIDPSVYRSLVDAGIVGPIEPRITGRFYAEAFVREGRRLARLFEEAGYRQLEDDTGFAHYVR